jgi:hypothetical protein
MAARVDSPIIERTLLNQIASECGDDVWALCRDSEGRTHVCATGRCNPTPVMQTYASELLDGLNAHADLDGAWAVAWCDPALTQQQHALWLRVPTRLVWMHLDRDGDVNFLLDTESPIADLVDEGVRARIENAVQGHKEYRSMMADIGVRPDQKRKAALGQASADPRVRFVPFVS